MLAQKMLYKGFPYNLELWKVTVVSNMQNICKFDAICDD